MPKTTEDKAREAIKAWVIYHEAEKAFDAAREARTRAVGRLQEAVKAVVSSGTSGYFQLDGDYYKIEKGPASSAHMQISRIPVDNLTTVGNLVEQDTARRLKKGNS